MLCLLCGVQNHADAKFCQSCGAQLWGSDSSNPPRADDTKSSAPRPIPSPAQTVETGQATVRRSSSPNPNAAALKPSLRPASYVLRHWRGDLTLPVAYWVNVVLIGVALAALIGMLAGLLDSSISIWTMLAALVGFWSLVYAVTIWQLVGAWRSANKHRLRGGYGGWAMAARVMLVFGILQSAYVGYTQAAPQIGEVVKIASGNDPAGRWQIRVIRNATEAEISGGIGFGLTTELRRVLDAHPTVKLLHLNSDGGRIGEARRLRDLIESRGLYTYTSTRCVSACVVAFVAGRERLIGSAGRLGFHTYAFPGLTSENLATEMAADRSDFVRRGVDTEFATRAFRNSNEMWYPTQSELIAAGVVSRVAGFAEVAISGIPLDNLDGIDKLLRSMKLFAAFADHDRETYRKILSEYTLSIQRGDSMAELRRRTLPLAMNVVHQRLPFASDNAVLSFVSIMLEQMQILYKKDPAKCHAYVAGLESTTVVSDLSSTLEREQQIAAEVIRTAAAGVWERPQQTRVSADLERLWTSMAEWFGNDVEMLQTPIDPSVDPKKYCEMIYALYGAAMELPQPRAAQLVKFLFADTQ